MREYREVDEIKDLSTREIINRLESLGIKFEIERFKEQSRGYILAEQLVHDQDSTRKSLLCCLVSKNACETQVQILNLGEQGIMG